MVDSNSGMTQQRKLKRISVRELKMTLFTGMSWFEYLKRESLSFRFIRNLCSTLFNRQNYQEGSVH